MIASLNAVAMAPEAPEMNELWPACACRWGQLGTGAL